MCVHMYTHTQREKEIEREDRQTRVVIRDAFNTEFISFE